MADCSGDRVAPTTLLNHNRDSSMPGVERRGVCVCVCVCVCACVCVCVRTHAPLGCMVRRSSGSYSNLRVVNPQISSMHGMADPIKTSDTPIKSTSTFISCVN